MKIKNSLMKLVLNSLIFLLLINISAQSQTMIEIRPDWNPVMDNRTEWWNDAKYGMFIHWGPDALPRDDFNRRNATSKEWEKHSVRLNPVDFNAKEWVSIIRDAGIKYVVYIAKHHNGFSMFDSKYTTYDIIDHTPFDRDPLKELSDACFEAGIKLGIYYSNTDLYHPDFPQKYTDRPHCNPHEDADLEKYVEFMQNQIEELMSNYGKVDIFWVDDGGAFRPEEEIPEELKNVDFESLSEVERVKVRKELRKYSELIDGLQNEAMLESYLDEYPELIHSEEIMKMMRSYQPDIIINDRFGHGTIDFLTPEEFVPDYGRIETFHNFEVCLTMNGTWMYRKDMNDWMEKSKSLRNLVDVASRGGNYLLNVGPTPEGIIPQEAVDILKYTGNWLRKYGESIYNTKGSQWGEPEWGRVTYKTNADGTTRLYLHVYDWPTDGKLILKNVYRRPIQAYAMRSIPRNYFNVKIAPGEGSSSVIEISLEGNAWDADDSVIVLDVDKAK
jgi:alpha-L-fucosidase